MANKQDVSDAFYEGICVVLGMANVGRSLARLEGIDASQFHEFVDRHPEYETYRELSVLDADKDTN